MTLAVLGLVGALVQAASLSHAPAPVVRSVTGDSLPFTSGELSAYEVRFGKLRVGEASMEVLDGNDVRGRQAWHTRFRVRGGVPFFRVDDVLESWIDRRDFVSLRFRENIDQGNHERLRTFEIFPERQAFRQDSLAEQPSVSDPLDEGAFLYFVRTIPLEVGATYSFERYFRPDRNPVVVRVVGRETVRVPAGTFRTIVVQPIIKARGIFSERGEARIWLTDDHRRIMVQLKTRTRIGSLNLHLTSYRQTNPSTR